MCKTKAEFRARLSVCLSVRAYIWRS